MGDENAPRRFEHSRYVWHMVGAQTLRVAVVGPTEHSGACEQRDAFFRLLDAVDGSLHVLLDLNHAQKASSAARKVWQEILAHEKTGRVAFFGLHPVARALANIVIKVSRKQDTRFFASEEQARAWLAAGEAAAA